MVTIFSRDYFGSEWCLNELDLMHDRLRNHTGGELIIPLIFHDGDLIPDEIGRLQSVNMLDYRNPHMQPNTPRFEKFADAIGSLAPRIVAVIAAAPPHDPAWNPACCARFDAVYAASRGRTTTVPLTTITRKPLPVPTLPPRVSP